MSYNRRKHPNSIPVASFAPWLVILFFVAVVGLSYVYLKNQLLSTGDQIRNLERGLTELQMKNEVARAKVSSLSSRAALQRCLADGFIKMKPIADNRIVRIGGKASQSAASEIQPVANMGIAR